mgnify:CR=1 FL=1
MDLSRIQSIADDDVFFGLMDTVSSTERMAEIQIDREFDD